MPDRPIPNLESPAAARAWVLKVLSGALRVRGAVRCFVGVAFSRPFTIGLTAVRDFEDKADNGSTEVRQWAAKTCPKVQQHLEQARTIREALEQAEDNNVPRGEKR